MPKVSVLLPAYNSEAFLGEALESILNQTFTDFEVLVVNDQSTDRTEQIIGEFAEKDKRVKLLQNEYAKGIVGALNTALKHAAGTYLARADGDDLLRNYRFKLQVDFLDQNPDVMILGGGFAPFTSRGHVRDIYHPSPSIEIAWRMICNAYFCHPTLMFRKKIYEEFGGYPQEKSEDFVYFSKIIRHYKGYNLHMILLDYREHEQNLSKTNAVGISESAKRAFEENYMVYVPDGRLMNEFYAFAEHGQLALRDFLPLSVTNVGILNKIRKNYKMSIFSYDYLRINAKVMWMMVRILLKKFKAKV